MALAQETLATLAGDVFADDVRVTLQTDGTLLCVYSAVTEDRNDVIYAAQVGANGEVEPSVRLTKPARRAFRPALASRSGRNTHVVAASIGNDRGTYGPAVLFLEDGTPRGSWQHLPHTGQVFVVAATCSAADGSFWLAWEEQQPLATRIVVGRLRDDGSCSILHTIDGGRCPSMSWPHLAWIDAAGRGVRVARLDPATGLAETGGPERAGALPDMPTLATGPDDTIFVAWHAQVGPDDAPDVMRWLRLHRAATADGEWTPIATGPTAEDVRSVAEDQGWEFPAVLAGADHLVLAGRSCQGWHVAAWRNGRYVGRAAISPHGWGGRGRSVALLHDAGGAPLVARRESRGVTLSRLVMNGAVTDDLTPADPEPLVVPGPAPRSTTVLFGDLHQHAAHSDACGTAEGIYAWSRDRRALDFASLTEHDRFCRRDIGPATWSYLCQVADTFNEDGRFVAIRGFEFTGTRFPGPGHKCVYFGESVPDRLPPKDVDALFAVLREHNGIAVPHHTGWTGADLEHHDPVLQPVWEICSVHGAYECQRGPHLPPRQDVVLPGQFIADALSAGMVFGLIGSTDNHGLCWHHGIHRRRDPSNAGLAAVHAREHSRVGILDALRARHCYATTGTRILLDIDADGAPMGTDLGRAPPPEVAVTVHAHAPVSELAFVCDGREAHTVAGEASLEARWRPRPSAKGPRHVLFVRVLLADGEMAWSSPIWWETS